MFEIVIDLLYTDKPRVTEQAKQCFVAWKEGSATELERVCEAPLYDTLADCKADLKSAAESFREYFTLEQMTKERVYFYRVRCRASEGEKIS